MIKLLSLIGFSLIFSAAGDEAIEARIFTNAAGDTLPYRILKPAGYNSGEKFPLVLCLHGAGGRGTDNQSKGVQAFTTLSAPAVQAQYPAFLLTPQCPADAKWVDTPWEAGSYPLGNVPVSAPMKLVLEILDAVQKEFNIDSARIYVTGQSMGGYGTWNIIQHRPEIFAAAIPVCGGGDPSQAEKIAGIPIWAFHGGKDTTVPPSASRDMVEALKIAGGNIKYTEYPDVAHASWVNAWKEPNILSWLFSQKK